MNYGHPISVGVGHYKGRDGNGTHARSAVLVFQRLTYGRIVNEIITLGNYRTVPEFDALAENARRTGLYRSAVGGAVVCDAEDAETHFARQRDELRHEGRALIVRDRTATV